MATGRDDFVIAFRSAFLKKKDKQKFSLLSLILLSIIVIILSNINFKPIKFIKIGINEIIYRTSYIISKPENYLKSLNFKLNEHFKLLENLDLWIVEGLRDDPHEAHAHFDLTFEWINRVRPKKSILTHLGHVDYDYVLSICPENVYPGYDGMTFDL